jgi:hypothetical protein
MTAIFGELMTFSQEKGPEVKLRVYGDEYYSRRETRDGYTVIYDLDLGRFVYALLEEGRFVSSGIDITMAPPEGARPHLEESDGVRKSKAANRFSGR